MTVVAGLHEPRCTNDPCTCVEVPLLLAPADETLGFPKPTPRAPTVPTRLQARPRAVAPALKAQVLARDNYTCQWCWETGGTLDSHHILPRSRGGRDELGNLISIHRRCHRYAHEHPEEARKRGFIA